MRLRGSPTDWSEGQNGEGGWYAARPAAQRLLLRWRPEEGARRRGGQDGAQCPGPAASSAHGGAAHGAQSEKTVWPAGFMTKGTTHKGNATTWLQTDE